MCDKCREAVMEHQRATDSCLNRSKYLIEKVNPEKTVESWLPDQIRVCGTHLNYLSNERRRSRYSWQRIQDLDKINHAKRYLMTQGYEVTEKTKE